MLSESEDAEMTIITKKVQSYKHLTSWNLLRDDFFQCSVRKVLCLMLFVSQFSKTCWEVHGSTQSIVAFCTQLEKNIFLKSVFYREFLNGNHTHTISKIYEIDHDRGEYILHIFFHFWRSDTINIFRFSMTLSPNYFQAKFSKSLMIVQNLFFNISVIHHNRKKYKITSNKWYWMT